MTTPAAIAAAILITLATSAAAQDAGWTYVDSPEPAQLNYLAQGDLEPSVVLTCVKDSRQLVARFSVSRKMGALDASGRWLDDVGRPAPWPVSVTLTSAEFQTTIPGHADVRLPGDGSVIAVEFADRAPVAEAFRQTGVLSLAALGEVVTPAPAPRRPLQSFLRYCR